jgi:hypothetical protein
LKALPTKLEGMTLALPGNSPAGKNFDKRGQLSVNARMLWD